MINNYIHYKVLDEITYPFPNYNGAVKGFIPHFVVDVVTYPCYD